MERQAFISSLHDEVETLIRLHRHGLYDTSGYQARKKRIEKMIQEHQIDVKKELDPLTQLLYHRYFL